MLMTRKKVPQRLWEYALVWIGKIIARTWNVSTNRTGLERFTGDTAGISEWFEFGFYDDAQYWGFDKNNKGMDKLENWLGFAHRIGGSLCYSILGRMAKSWCALQFSV